MLIHHLLIIAILDGEYIYSEATIHLSDSSSCKSLLMSKMLFGKVYPLELLT